jgi:hypothetical protein
MYRWRLRHNLLPSPSRISSREIAPGLRLMGRRLQRYGLARLAWRMPSGWTVAGSNGWQSGTTDPARAVVFSIGVD